MVTTILTIASVSIGALSLILKLWWGKRSLEDQELANAQTSINVMGKTPQAIEKVDSDNLAKVVKINSGLSNSDANKLLRSEGD